MARQKAADQVETLRKQQKELADKLKEAQKKASKEAAELKRRKNEIAGALVLETLEQAPASDIAQKFRDLLNIGLTKAADRVLFGFDPLPKTPKPENAATPTTPETAAQA